MFEIHVLCQGYLVLCQGYCSKSQCTIAEVRSSESFIRVTNYCHIDTMYIRVSGNSFFLDLNSGELV